jgi:hypothetical protein
MGAARIVFFGDRIVAYRHLFVSGLRIYLGIQVSILFHV